MKRKLTDPLKRFWEKIQLSDDGCWLWAGCLFQASGYGCFFPGGYGCPNNVLAHRWLWEKLNGPVPEGLELDHLCRVRHCVNPMHLEPVTRRMNIMRSPIVITANFSRQTRCKNGHEFSHHDRKQRLCRICGNAYKKAYKLRKKAEAA
jgi:HNH endonuclease